MPEVQSAGGTSQKSRQPVKETSKLLLHTPVEKKLSTATSMQHVANLDAFSVQTNLSPADSFIGTSATIAAVELNVSESLRNAEWMIV